MVDKMLKEEMRKAALQKESKVEEAKMKLKENKRNVEFNQ